MAPISLSLLILLAVATSSAASPAGGGGSALFPNPCSEQCGGLFLPYPFHLNSSCGPPVDAFRLSCSQTQTSKFLLYLTLIGPTDLRVISFLPSGALLLDYSSNSSTSSSPCDRWYGDINDTAGVLDRSSFFSVTADNVLRLYDCDDSSVCRSGCERVGGAAAGCEGDGAYQGCCYPLSDGSVWRAGQGFSVFAEYGCRGFSSWVVPPRSVGAARRGIEVEWAVPRRLGDAVACADGAVAGNATAVKGGFRCACGPGLVGDGFAHGIGCFKACSDDGQSKNGDCCKGRLCRRRVAVLVIGALISVVFLVGALAICFFLKSSFHRNKHQMDQACLPKILGKACGTRLFTYEELNDATKGFDQEQKLSSIVDGTIHMGIIDDGSLVAVQKVSCESEQNLRQVWEIVEILSHLSHKNIARIIGCCISSNNTLLVVHEFFSHGTLEEHLQGSRGNYLGWYRRISIAAEVASALAFLQTEISPPINLHDLKSSELFIDAEYSIKIVGFKFLSSRIQHNGSCSAAASQVGYNFGLILLELITGSRKECLSGLNLLKIKDISFHEIVDPYLKFGEQMLIRREQIERVTVFAMQCLARKMDEGKSMVEIAKEFIQISTDDGMEGSGKPEPILEVTFSNSSLLQMVSTSPDSIHMPSKDCLET